MTEEKKNAPWIRAGCVLVGVFAIVRAVETLNPVVNFISVMPDEINRDSILWPLIGSLIAPIVLFIIGYYLISHCHSISTRITGNAGPKISYREFAAYRLAFTFVGVLIISVALPRLGEVASDFVLTKYCDENDLGYRRMGWIILIWSLIKTALGIYILLGAPHIIKWQTRRTGEYICPSENGEHQDEGKADSGREP